jgi:hypothetical protein
MDATRRPGASRPPRRGRLPESRAQRGTEEPIPLCSTGSFLGVRPLDPSTRAPAMAGDLAQDVAPRGRNEEGAPGMPGGAPQAPLGREGSDPAVCRSVRNFASQHSRLR